MMLPIIEETIIIRPLIRRREIREAGRGRRIIPQERIRRVKVEEIILAVRAVRAIQADRANQAVRAIQAVRAAIAKVALDQPAEAPMPQTAGQGMPARICRLVSRCAPKLPACTVVL